MEYLQEGQLHIAFLGFVAEAQDFVTCCARKQASDLLKKGYAKIEKLTLKFIQFTERQTIFKYPLKRKMKTHNISRIYLI